MRKFVMFLSGLLLMLIMFAALFLSGAIYDTGKKATVETFFFKPDDSFMQRPEVASPSDLDSDELRNMLISRYITEYFYVIPNVANVTSRIDGETSLNFMSHPDVFAYWKKNVAPTIQEMAEAGKLRLVQLTNVEKAEHEKDYWIVEYNLITWNKPNDLSETPTVTPGQVYLKMFNEGMRTELREKPIEYWLEKGKDPVVAFKFGVFAVSSYEETVQIKK